ncbi:MAG: hypothetical protein M1472_03420, partial [Planctomycetes bacterium]|nr:hypothetical protein [Planctomycetota bacterium]
RKLQVGPPWPTYHSAPEKPFRLFRLLSLISMLTASMFTAALSVRKTPNCSQQASEIFPIHQY